MNPVGVDFVSSLAMTRNLEEEINQNILNK
jgi:hypothetical protein